MFSERLKQLRYEKNVLQKDIANFLNISTSAYGFYEQGKRVPDTDILKNLAEYFNISLDYLLCKSDIRESADDVISKNQVTKQSKDEKIDTIAAHLDGKDISPKKMKLMLNYIDALFDEFDD